MDSLTITKNASSSVFIAGLVGMVLLYFTAEPLHLIKRPVKYGSPYHHIMLAATRHGVNQSLLLGISDIETIGTFDPKIRPRNRKTGKFIGTARGLFQFINSTGTMYGLTHQSDAAAQADAGARFTRDNIRGLKMVHPNPPPGSVYLAHFLGLGDAKKVLAAPNHAISTNVLREQVFKNNVFLKKYKQIGGIKRWATRKMKRAMSRHDPSNVKVYMR